MLHAKKSCSCSRPSETIAETGVVQFKNKKNEHHTLVSERVDHYNSCEIESSDSEIYLRRPHKKTLEPWKALSTSNASGEGELLIRGYSRVSKSHSYDSWFSLKQEESKHHTAATVTYYYVICDESSRITSSAAIAKVIFQYKTSRQHTLLSEFHTP